MTEFGNKTVKVSIKELEEGIYTFSDAKQGELLLKKTKMMHELTLKIRSLRDDIEDFAFGKKVKNNKGEVGTIVGTHDDGLCVQFENSQKKWFYRGSLEEKEYELV